MPEVGGRSVVRDLYKSALFPNYYFVKLILEADRLHGAMYRISNPEVDSLDLPGGSPGTDPRCRMCADRQILRQLPLLFALF